MMPIIGLAGKAGSGKDTVASMLCENGGGVAIAQADPLKRFALNVLDFTEHQLWGPSEARNAPDPRSAKDIQDLWDKKNYGLRNPMILWLESVGLSEGQFYLLERWARGHLFGIDNITPRSVLQSLGTEFGRMIDSQIWVNLVQKDAARLLAEPSDYSRTAGIKPGILPANFVVVTDVRFRNEVLAIRRNNGAVINITGPDAKGLSGKAGQHSSEKELESIPRNWYDAVLVNDKSHGLGQLKEQVVRIKHELFCTYMYKTRSRSEEFADLGKSPDKFY